MKLSICWLLLALLLSPFTSFAQTPSGQLGVPSASTDVPKLVRFSGKAMDDDGKPLSGAVGVTFSLYKDQQGGSPLWVETQNVQADATGHYTALLGSASVEGVPLSLFSSGEAQWLGVQVQGQPAQPRVLLVSVPYALKAHEAETLSGKSISDFVLLNKSAAVPTTAGNAPAISSGASGSKSPSAANGPTSFVGSNTTQIVTVTQKGTGVGLSATATTHAAVAGAITGKSNTAVYGLASNTSKGSNAAGVTGVADTETGPGVQGVTSSAAGFGVQGVANSSTGGTGVQGINNATSGISAGVSGQSASTGNGSAGVVGNESATTGQVYGVFGSASSTTTNAIGVGGYEGATKGQVYGVAGNTSSTGPNAAAVNGYEGATTGQVSGVNGSTPSTGTGAAGVSGFEGATTGHVYGVTGGTNSSTSGASGVNGYEGSKTGQVFGVFGSTTSATNFAAGVSGNASATTGQVYGVVGVSNSTTNGAAAVNGYEPATTGQVSGVNGSTPSTGTGAAGVSGFAAATTGRVYGVTGGTNSTTNFAAGVIGSEGAATGEVFGVTGSTNSTTSGSSGLNGFEGATTGGPVYGVSGYSTSTGGIGVFGSAQATSGFAVGVEGATNSPGGVGGQFVNVSGSGTVLLGSSGSGYTTVFTVDASGNGFYAGNLNVKGKLTKGSGSFKIDHPLDPANKYLSHSFVESPDMMNVYNGNIATDRRGLATVNLPDYFEALNGDFRYQLTVIGQFAQAIVAKKIAANRFVIQTSKPNVEVSWQVTGIRHDAYANAYRIPTEEDKPTAERGHYLHPEVFGQPASKNIQAAGQKASATDPLAKASNP
jgi:trimeric autotransporter adhesin